jgi:hypothetical protein
MRTVKLSAGDNIEATCTRCRKVLNHTIVAMVGEKVVRVECNTCRGVHNYREAVASKPASAGATARKKEPAVRPAKKDAGAAEREEWEALSQTMDRGRAIAYDIDGKFKVNDLVDHTVFGLGVVKLVIKPSKMEVLFQQGKKLLRCR